MTADEQLVADAVDDLAHGLAPDALLRELVAEARERGRQEVRAYAAGQRKREEARLVIARRDAATYLAPDSSPALAAQHAIEAAQRSAAVIAYGVVAGWHP